MYECSPILKIKDGAGHITVRRAMSKTGGERNALQLIFSQIDSKDLDLYVDCRCD